MIIFPAIDLYEGKAVRLLHGDYAQMTVYSDDPAAVGEDFVREGATHAHLVDLEGARSGETPNLDTVLKIRERTGLFCEIGGGIRTMETIRKYLDHGLDRVILGTAAVTDEKLLRDAAERYGERIAVGVDVKDGEVAIRGWLEKSGVDFFSFCEKMAGIGIRTLICTDISRDGAMKGVNPDIYRMLKEKLDVDITASGGVSTLEDVRQLAAMNLYGAIVGKAYYTGAVRLREAIGVAG